MLAHSVLQQPLPVLREHRGVEAALHQLHAQEPAEQQVVVQLLTEGALAPHRVERNQQGCLQQALRRNGRPPHVRIHPVELGRQPGQGLIGQGLDGAERVIGWHALFHVHEGQHRHLRLLPSTHTLHLPLGVPLFSALGALSPPLCVSWFFSSLLVNIRVRHHPTYYIGLRPTMDPGRRGSCRPSLEHLLRRLLTYSSRAEGAQIECDMRSFQRDIRYWRCCRWSISSLELLAGRCRSRWSKMVMGGSTDSESAPTLCSFL